MALKSPRASRRNPLFAETNARRELAYSIGHANHHYATIRLIRHIGVDDPAGFGNGQAAT